MYLQGHEQELLYIFSGHLQLQDSLQQLFNHMGIIFLHLKYGLQQTGEWSPRFYLQATFLSKSYFHTWAIVLQRLYDQKQLITVGIKNFSDISTAPHIRDHKKNGLQAHLKHKFEWTVLPISQQLFPHSQLSYLKFKYQKNLSIYK
ncbi:hypothetical protein P8452_65444 [Trifolium repens]|nr:hypothetical protein QL285_096946 [Trifolium repens]WJX82722.1 hypothetical protein P8452_65444 [Trifolium repens]